MAILFLSRNVLLACELQTFENKIYSIINTNHEVICQEVISKLLTEDPGNMICNDYPEYHRHPNMSEFCGVLLVLVETEEMGVR